jgi:hypothetical protein
MEELERRRRGRGRDLEEVGRRHRGGDDEAGCSGGGKWRSWSAGEEGGEGIWKRRWGSGTAAETTRRAAAEGGREMS